MNNPREDTGSEQRSAEARMTVEERRSEDPGRTEPVGPLGLRVGQRARRTQTVTAREVELYAQITGDRNPLHFDSDFAARTRFGRLVAQGGIASGMLNALVAMDLPGAGTVFMSQSLRYLAPTYLGDTLTAEVEVLALKPEAGLPAPRDHHQSGRHAGARRGMLDVHAEARVD